MLEKPVNRSAYGNTATKILLSEKCSYLARPINSRCNLTYPITALAFACAIITRSICGDVKACRLRLTDCFENLASGLRAIEDEGKD